VQVAVNSSVSSVWSLLEPVTDLLRATAASTTKRHPHHHHHQQQQQQWQLLSAGVSDFDQLRLPVVTSSLPATTNDTRQYSIRQKRFSCLFIYYHRQVNGVRVILKTCFILLKVKLGYIIVRSKA